MTRRVKGTDLIEPVKALRDRRKRAPLPALGVDAAALLELRILPASWYPMEPFRELLGVLHRIAFDGTDDGAVAMGKLGANVTLRGPQAAYVAHGDPSRTLAAFERIWRAHYDFGRVEVDLVPGAAATFRLFGYGDMPRFHGMIIVGWLMAATELSGGKEVAFDLRSAPWLDADYPLGVDLRWS